MIFVFLIFLIKILTVKSILSFKVIKKSSCDCYFIIMYDGIYEYNDYQSFVYFFNTNQKITSQEDFDFISLNILLNNSYIFLTKNFIYFFDEKENINIILNSFNDDAIYSSQIISLENNIIYDNYDSIYYFIAFGDKNKSLNINYYRIKKISDTFENEKIYSINVAIDSKYFSCQLMKETFYENILTCFYKNEDSLFLEANSFIIENNSILKNAFNSSIILKNVGNNISIKSIKSILSQNSSFCFVCYITDVNNTCECLLYDINKNELNYYGIYLDNCLSNYSSLDIIYYNLNNTIEYILYCFISETEISLVKLNDNFKIIEDNKNGIYAINNFYKDFCSEIYLSYLFYKSDYYSSEFYIFLNCDGLIFDEELIQIENFFDDPIPTDEPFLYDLESNFNYQIPTDEPFLYDLESNFNDHISIDEPFPYDVESNYNETIPTDEPLNFDLDLNKSLNDLLEELKELDKEISRFLNLSNNSHLEELWKELNNTELKLEPLKPFNFSLIDFNYFLEENLTTFEVFMINLEGIISSFEIGKNYDYRKEDFNLLIQPTNSSFSGNSTHIYFEECEAILREKYNISSERILSFIFLEIHNEDITSLVNYVEYQVFDDNKNLLNLSYCSDQNIKIVYSLKDTLSDSDFDKLKRFQENNIDLLDLNDRFYNDICFPYSEGDSDLTLKDRVNKYFKNFTLCEVNCEYKSIDLEKMTITCDCTVKIELNKNIQKDNEIKKEANIQNIVVDTIKDSTYDVIKCKDLVFFENKKNNSGFWLYLILVSINIFMIFSYLIFRVDPIKIHIMKEMEKFHYIPRIKNPLKKKKKLIKNKNECKIALRNIKDNSKKIINKNKKNKKKKRKLKSIDLLDKDISNNSKDLSLKKFKVKKYKNSLLTAKDNRKKSDENKNIKKEKSKSIKSKIKNFILKKNIKNIFNIKHYHDSYFILNKKKWFKTLHNYNIKPKFIYNKISIEKPQYSYTFPNLVRKTGINENNSAKKCCFCPYLYNIINIDANNYEKTKSYIKYFLYDYDYEDAIIYENRSFCDIFFIILVLQEKIINTLFFRSPLELQPLRICLLIFIYSCSFSLNTLFYFSDKISEKYHYKNNNNLFFFSIVNNIYISLISTAVSSVSIFILRMLTN